MSDIIQFQNDLALNLLSKVTLNGVTILTEDRQDIVNEVQRALAELGTAIIIGVPKGTNEAPNSPGLQEMLTVTAVIMENVVLNRNRTVNATVASDVERLALAGTVSIGEVVEQTNVTTGKYSVSLEGYATPLIDLFTNPEANFLENRLNEMDSISQAGGVSVTGTLATGYTVTWDSNGSRGLLMTTKGATFPLGAVVRVREDQVGTASLPAIQTILIRQWFWLFSGNGATTTNWGYFFTSRDILQLAMRVLHSFAPSPTQKVVANGFYHGPRKDIVEIAAQFTIRMYLDQTAVT